MGLPASQAIVLLVALTGCTVPVPSAEPQEAAVPPVPRFSDPFLLARDWTGSEPTLAIDAAGRLFVAASTGTLAPRAATNGASFIPATRVWRSLDAGTTYSPIEPPLVLGYGASHAGFASDIATGPGGILFVLDAGPKHVGVLRSTDAGASWDAAPLASSILPDKLRHWMDVDQQSGDVYLAINNAPTGLWIVRSQDGGRSFSPVANAVPNDRRNNCQCQAFLLAEETRKAIVLAYNLHPGVAVSLSTDGAQTFSHHRVPGLESSLEELPVLAHDEEGNLYLAAQMADRVWLTISHDLGRTWSAKIPVGPAEARFHAEPWIAVGSPGRVVLTYHELLGGQVFQRASFSYDALGPTPTFHAVPLGTDPVAPDGFGAGIGAFAEVAVDPQGAAHVVWQGFSEGSQWPRLFAARQVEGEPLRAPGPAPRNGTAAQAVSPQP